MIQASGLTCKYRTRLYNNENKTFYYIDTYGRCYKTLFSVIYAPVGVFSVIILRECAKSGINYAEKSFITLTAGEGYYKCFPNCLFNAIGQLPFWEIEGSVLSAKVTSSTK